MYGVDLARRGLWKGYFALDNEKKLDKSTLVWVDKDQIYFISNTSSLRPGMPYERDKLIRFDDSPHAYTVRVEFGINQPRVSEIYYSVNQKIYESNRTIQDDLQLKRNIQTKDWSIRVNTSVIGINDVATYYLGKTCKWWDDMNPAEFYCNLAQEMIDNRWTEIRTRINQAGEPIEYTGCTRNIVTNCIPTKKKSKRKTQDSLKDTKFLAQYRCKVCGAKNTNVCSSCGDYLCHDKLSRFCLDAHCEENNQLSH